MLSMLVGSKEATFSAFASGTVEQTRSTGSKNYGLKGRNLKLVNMPRHQYRTVTKFLKIKFSQQILKINNLKSNLF